MKKKYVKPEAIFESFELSASVAAGCSPSGKAQFSQGECAFKIGGSMLFIEAVDACVEKVPDGGTYCYHVPEGAGTKIFSSRSEERR